MKKSIVLPIVTLTTALMALASPAVHADDDWARPFIQLVVPGFYPAPVVVAAPYGRPYYQAEAYPAYAYRGWRGDDDGYRGGWHGDGDGYRGGWHGDGGRDGGGYRGGWHGDGGGRDGGWHRGD